MQVMITCRVVALSRETKAVPVRAPRIPFLRHRQAGEEKTVMSIEQVRRLLCDESGQDIAEYAVMLAVNSRNRSWYDSSDWKQCEQCILAGR